MRDPVHSRRTFLQTSGAIAGAAVATLAAPTALRAAASESLSVGIVGPGGRGSGLLRTFFDEYKEGKARLTAVCDLWTRNRERSAARVKQAVGQEPRQFRRLEDMLAWDGLDAILIATPDHAHARHLTQCLRAGKHVYCEKPFANVLEEANAAIDAYRKTDKVVTLGTQRRSDPRYLAAREVVASGVLGPLVGVDLVLNAHSPYRWRRPTDVRALKEKDTDWKAFLLGRKERPFDPHQYLEFRLYHDFSTGIIDQWMTHMIDAAHMLSGATFPRSVVAHGGTYAWKDGRENGDTVHVLLDYPQGFLCSYSSTLASASGRGCRLLGRDGTLEFEQTWRYTDKPSAKGKPGRQHAVEPKKGFAGDMDHIHMRNWLECIHQGRRQTHCTAEHGYQHAVACILADRALHTGRRQVFDEKRRTIREG